MVLRCDGSKLIHTETMRDKLLRIQYAADAQYEGLSNFCFSTKCVDVVD